ncbi:MAG TPA: GNAT family N-acetyltransferase [Lentimicrobium sp.]|nr:GNAT family N-acetyltransferase [Lentimicrobium sp.]
MIGENISLRALEPDDARLLYIWENDPEVWHVSNTIVPYSQFAIDQYILNSGDIYTSKQLRLMIILNNEPTTAIGAIDLFDFDPQNSRAELGILIRGEFRGKGFAQEAIELMKEYTFTTLNLHQLYVHVPADNLLNLHLFSKCGFVQTGTLKEWRRHNENWSDEHIMQLIR